MQQIPVCELQKDMRFEGFLLVRSVDKRTGIKGTDYLDLNLCDKTGEINAKLWDLNCWKSDEPLPECGSVVKARGGVIEYNGRLQYRIDLLRPAQSTDDFDFSLLAPCSPEKPEAMIDELRSIVSSISSEPLRKITEYMIDQNIDKLMYYPGAQRIHHAERSGLLHHTLGVLHLAQKVSEIYPDLNKDLLFSGAAIHDLGKTEEFLSDGMGIVKDYSKSGLLIGHIAMGVARIQEAADALGITGEPVVLLQHMILSHHGEADFGSPRPPMFPEAEVLHWCDLLDARLNEMENALDRMKDGTFSDKIWSLDRRLYHPDFDTL